MTILTAVLGLWFARRSLAPAERMFERLTQFTHDASHELRTPLAVVNSELDLALRTGEPEKHILAAKEELKVGARLVDDLLGLAVLDAATLEGQPVDLSVLAAGEVERLAPLAEGKRDPPADRHRAGGRGQRPTKVSWSSSSRISWAMQSSSHRPAARSRCR